MHTQPEGRCRAPCTCVCVCEHRWRAVSNTRPSPCPQVHFTPPRCALCSCNVLWLHRANEAVVCAQWGHQDDAPPAHTTTSTASSFPWCAPHAAAAASAWRGRHTSRRAHTHCSTCVGAACWRWRCQGGRHHRSGSCGRSSCRHWHPVLAVGTECQCRSPCHHTPTEPTSPTFSTPPPAAGPVPWPWPHPCTEHGTSGFHACTQTSRRLHNKHSCCAGTRCCRLDHGRARIGVCPDEKCGGTAPRCGSSSRECCDWHRRSSRASRRNRATGSSSSNSGAFPLPDCLQASLSRRPCAAAAAAATTTTTTATATEVATSEAAKASATAEASTATPAAATAAKAAATASATANA